MNEEAVTALVQRIRKKSDHLNIYSIQSSVSYGWDTKYEENQSIMTILNNSEKKMYQKKFLYSNSKRNDIIKSIHNTLLIKLPKEEIHAKRVSFLCEEVAKAYRFDEDIIKELKIAGYLHDIGKIAIDENILNKTGQLSESERNQIEKHPEIGYRLLGATNEFINISECILAHHERWDGGGYPKGLKGEEICWKARVISIVDAYDAMTSDRPYRKALSKKQAIAEINKNAGTQFDPDIAKVFVKVILANDMIL
jgi:putative nucleotidyltransferase with HDIG domain